MPSFGLSAFRYSSEPHLRRHGPEGYVNYGSYKQWLRDEFSFRCVFCLVRERWCHDGPNGFGVDHLEPLSKRPDLECVYENLIYLCNRCNSAKRISSVIDPCKSALNHHLRLQEDGAIAPLTTEGRHVINALNLNYQRAREYRRRKINSLDHWRENGDSWSIQQDLAFPEDLPRLDDCRCANTRPEGIAESFHAQRQRGELETTY